MVLATTRGRPDHNTLKNKIDLFAVDLRDEDDHTANASDPGAR